MAEVSYGLTQMVRSSFACLSASFHDGRGELAKVLQLFGDDRMDDIEIEGGIFMDGHVSKADHSL